MPYVVMLINVLLFIVYAESLGMVWVNGFEYAGRCIYVMEICCSIQDCSLENT